MSFVNTLKNTLEKLQNAAKEQAERITVIEEERDRRLAICKGCENFIKRTNQCKLCGCFMGAKTWAPNATCPANKW